MKKLEQNVYNTTTSVRDNKESVQNLETAVEKLINGLKLAQQKLQIQSNNFTKLSFDGTAIGEWQALTDNHIIDLQNELANITDDIMDKTFEKDDRVIKKLKEYDVKLLVLQSEYNSLQTDMVLRDQTTKDTVDKAEEQVRDYLYFGDYEN